MIISLNNKDVSLLIDLISKELRYLEKDLNEFNFACKKGILNFSEFEFNNRNSERKQQIEEISNLLIKIKLYMSEV